jgi:hypothetical protein
MMRSADLVRVLFYCTWLHGLLAVHTRSIRSDVIVVDGPTTRGCGVEDKTPEEAALIESKFFAKQKAKVTSTNGSPRVAGGVIDVYMHIITDSAGNGALSDEVIAAQIDVLNAAFAASGFSFREVERDITVNDVWYNMVSGGESSEYAAKRALRKGTGADLNFYTAALSDNLLGWATFPYSYDATYAYRDGVVCADFTLPGAGTGPYSLGDTGTHEVGHW